MIEHIVLEIHSLESQPGAVEIEVISDAPIGPRGIPGETGSLGVGETYIHSQVVPTDVWVIAHELNRYPALTVVDSIGRVVEGDVKYLSADEVEIEFSGAFSGIAYLN